MKQKIKNIFKNNIFLEIYKNSKLVVKKDVATKNILQAFLLNNGIHAIFWYRIAHFLYALKLNTLSRVIMNIVKIFTGIEIHPGATIGENLFIDHGYGIVIGETAIIGNNVEMFHNVTLGTNGKDSIGKRHPSIEDNVLLSAGVKVIGNVKIGKNSKIGANAVVINSIPSNATAIGIPAKVVRINGEKVVLFDESKTRVKTITKNENEQKVIQFKKAASI